MNASSTPLRAVIGSIVAFLALPIWAGEKGKFADVSIDEKFEPYLRGNPLLMEAGGAKLIRQKGGARIVLSVASTVLKNDSAKERLRAEKVCRIKALANVVAENKGVQVCHTETLNEKTVVVVDEDGESGRSLSELLQVTKTKVEGIAKDMPVVARWTSKDGEILYLAIGGRIDKNGEVIEAEDDE